MNQIIFNSTLPLLLLYTYIVCDCFFRPKCFCTSITLSKDEIEERVKEWLQVTTDTITSELNTALGVVTNIRGLHSIREDALKVGKDVLENV